MNVNCIFTSRAEVRLLDISYDTFSDIPYMIYLRVFASTVCLIDWLITLSLTSRQAWAFHEVIPCFTHCLYRITCFTLLSLLFLHVFYTFLCSSLISRLTFSFHASLAVFMPHFPTSCLTFPASRFAGFVRAWLSPHRASLVLTAWYLHSPTAIVLSLH